MKISCKEKILDDKEASIRKTHPFGSVFYHVLAFIEYLLKK